MSPVSHWVQLFYYQIPVNLPVAKKKVCAHINNSEAKTTQQAYQYIVNNILNLIITGARI